MHLYLPPKTPYLWLAVSSQHNVFYLSPHFFFVFLLLVMIQSDIYTLRIHYNISPKTLTELTRCSIVRLSIHCVTAWQATATLLHRATGLHRHPCEWRSWNCVATHSGPKITYISKSFTGIFLCLLWKRQGLLIKSNSYQILALN